VSSGREDQSGARSTDSTADPPTPRSVRSEDLLQGAKEVLIQHGQEIYRLRLTKAGKLILNK
jgi:hemin uptake protein HemP